MRWLSREHAETVRRLQPPLPAHYDGWMCIHSHEGPWGSTNPNGHYNGLQMTWGWGPLVGNPNDYTPMQILWAAEHEYMKPENHNHFWLTEQWGQTIGLSDGHGRTCWAHFD